MDKPTEDVSSDESTDTSDKWNPSYPMTQTLRRHQIEKKSKVATSTNATVTKSRHSKKIITSAAKKAGLVKTPDKPTEDVSSDESADSSDKWNPSYPMTQTLRRDRIEKKSKVSTSTNAIVNKSRHSKKIITSAAKKAGLTSSSSKAPMATLDNATSSNSMAMARSTEAQVNGFPFCILTPMGPLVPMSMPSQLGFPMNNNPATLWTQFFANFTNQMQSVGNNTNTSNEREDHNEKKRKKHRKHKKSKKRRKSKDGATIKSSSKRRKEQVDFEAIQSSNESEDEESGGEITHQGNANTNSSVENNEEVISDDSMDSDNEQAELEDSSTKQLNDSEAEEDQQADDKLDSQQAGSEDGLKNQPVVAEENQQISDKLIDEQSENSSNEQPSDFEEGEDLQAVDKLMDETELSASEDGSNEQPSDSEEEEENLHVANKPMNETGQSTSEDTSIEEGSDSEDQEVDAVLSIDDEQATDSNDKSKLKLKPRFTKLLVDKVKKKTFDVDFTKYLLTKDVVILSGFFSKKEMEPFQPENFSTGINQSVGDISWHESHVNCNRNDRMCSRKSSTRLKKLLYENKMRQDMVDCEDGVRLIDLDEITNKPTQEKELKHIEEALTLGEFYQQMKIDDPMLPKCGKMTSFYTNVQMSKPHWTNQLELLDKRFASLGLSDDKQNMLANLSEINGVNTWHFYLKPEGSRTFTHRENGSISSLNVNVGFNKCNWYCVSPKDTDRLIKLLQSINVKATNQTPFWLEESILERHNIKVTKVEQWPGDLIIICPGVWHCVEAAGATTNVAINFAPMDIKQYEPAMKHFHWDEQNGVQTIVGLRIMTIILAGKAMELKLERKLAQSLSSELATMRQIFMTEKREFSYKKEHLSPQFSTYWEFSGDEYKNIYDTVNDWCDLCQCELYNHRYVLSTETITKFPKLMKHVTKLEKVQLETNDLAYCRKCAFKSWNADVMKRVIFRFHFTAKCLQTVLQRLKKITNSKS